MIQLTQARCIAHTQHERVMDAIKIGAWRSDRVTCIIWGKAPAPCFMTVRMLQMAACALLPFSYVGMSACASMSTHMHESACVHACVCAHLHDACIRSALLLIFMLRCLPAIQNAQDCKCQPMQPTVLTAFEYNPEEGHWLEQHLVSEPHQTNTPAALAR